MHTFVILINKFIIQRRLKIMKKSVVVNHTYNSFAQKRDGFDIPKTTSYQQFFSLRNPRRKKRIEDLTSSMTIDFTRTQPTWIPSKARSAGLIEKAPSINDAVTQQSENVEKTICFKKRQNKQTVSRNIVQPITPKVSGNFWKLHIPQKHISPHPAVISTLNTSKQGGSLFNKKKWTKSDFNFLKKIGEGGYSEVFLAIQKATNFICSIKILRKASIKQQKLVHVVTRQLKIQHYLNHKNINALYGEFDDQEHIYLVGQYCTDGDLHKYLRQKQKQSEELDLLEVAQFVKQICDAVAVMHKDSLMHRDIKPENVFLTMGKCVKLGDFGWSVYNGDHGLRNTQCGTPLYLAPQLIQHHQYSQSIDIWAIGILAYELLTGQMPFKIRGTKDLSKIINQDIKFEYIDDQVARDFVMKLLEKDSKLRMEIQDVLQHPFLCHLQGND